MGRNYADPSYRVKQELPCTTTGGLNGTAASAATVYAHTFMQPVRLTDWNGNVVVGGTDAAVISLIIGKSLAGTGTFSAIGTMALSTHAVDTVVDASLTATSFSTGDDLIIQRSAGTSTSVLQVEACVQYTEAFEVNDN